jgi:hypothetical protein
MAAAKQPRIESISQIKITLKDIQPPIWRRFQVPGRISLKKLHRIIQTLMPWDGYHLHQFIIDGVDYGEPDPEADLSELKDDRYARLNKVVPAAPDRFIYEYDFGDGWEHEILVEKVLPPQEGVRYPICLAGKRACPPEDCGGVDGYADFLEAIRNPAHEEHDRILEWVGGSFDPEAFDLEGINLALKRIK